MVDGKENYKFDLGVKGLIGSQFFLWPTLYTLLVTTYLLSFPPENQRIPGHMHRVRYLKSVVHLRKSCISCLVYVFCEQNLLGCGMSNTTHLIVMVEYGHHHNHCGQGIMCWSKFQGWVMQTKIKIILTEPVSGVQLTSLTPKSDQHPVSPHNTTPESKS